MTTQKHPVLQSRLMIILALVYVGENTSGKRRNNISSAQIKAHFHFRIKASVVVQINQEFQVYYTNLNAQMNATLRFPKYNIYYLEAVLYDMT